MVYKLEDLAFIFTLLSIFIWKKGG